MIDTDNYEGHTQGPWYWDGNLCNDVHSDKHGINQWTVFDWEDGLLAKEVDMQLIADAPLLLEAYKRLREGIKQMADTWLNSPNMDGREKVVKMTNQMRELVE